jgi:NAD(P)-dependent dehydrogenase (short-subunit alcohol dehydrogenase family)
MEKFLSGKIAIVTGATRGIGRAIAARLLREGARVAICGRTRDSVDRAVNELRSGGEDITGFPADVSKLSDVQELFRNADKHFGGLDILINNAGIGVFRSVSDLTPEDWHRTIGVNLNGAFYCSHEALQRLRNRGGGYIVNISSLAGKNAFAGGAAYNASKFGLNGFSEAMMLDHRYDDVRVSWVMPGSVDTDFGGGAGSSDWKIAPEDVAEVVATLLRMPQRTLVSRVEMRPSKPQK